MDTATLIQEAKARFKHNESKIYLQDKYKARLTFAFNGGMWTATKDFLAFLNCTDGQIILADNYNNPVKVSAVDLREHAWKIYNDVMEAWLNEYQGLQGLR